MNDSGSGGAILSRFEGELGRRLVHASGAAIPLTYLLPGVEWIHVQALTVVALVGALGLEFVRLRIGLDWWIYEHLTREYEAEKVAGYGLYMVSFALVALVFDPVFAVPAMLALAFGDPISGSLSGDSLQRVKSPPVLVAMYVIAGGLTFASLQTAYPVEVAALAATAAGLAAAVADGVTHRIGDYIVDDNLTIPPYTAGAAWLTVFVVALVS